MSATSASTASTSILPDLDEAPAEGHGPLSSAAAPPDEDVGAVGDPCLTAALQYAERGLAVLPLHTVIDGTCTCQRPTCPSPGKHPHTLHGVKDASTDPVTIREWWTRWPSANIGIATGKVSGILVLDIDGREGLDALASIVPGRTEPIPHLGWATTGRGYHFYFRYPSEDVPTRRLGPGLEVRASGAYVVAPPSVHATGKQYSWKYGLGVEEGQGNLPAWLLDAIKGPTNGQAQSSTVPIREGERNEMLYRHGRSMRARGMGPEAIAVALKAENAANCEPPLPAEEVAEIAEKVVTQADRPDFLGSGEGQKGTAKGPGRQTSFDPISGSPPKLAQEALYGLAGRIVRTIDPHTEADPAAVLAHLLVGVGNVIGPGPHARVQHDGHSLRLNVVLVGPTAKGRKGMAWSTPRHLLAQIDQPWVQQRVLTGLSSGEGLIYHVRDARDDDPGEPDKRLLVIEPEFAVTLKNMARDTNTLSGIIREAWDSGNLGTLTKNSPLRATGAHVSIIGHITEEEVRRYLTETERANGFANRFLWLAVRRSKMLPEGGVVPEEQLAPLAEALREVMAFAKTVGELRRDDDARALWGTVYPSLSEGKPGLLGAIISRAEAQVLRLSALYAVLDRSTLIQVPHLQAALALWQYAEASARQIFGSRLGNPTADRILAALRVTGKDGLTETAIRDLFGRHKGGGEIDSALTLLAELGLARPEQRATGGRPVTVWQVVT